MKKLFLDRKTLYLVLAIVVVSIFTLSIAYAALSTVLTISGNSEVVASTWDIHLENAKVSNGSVTNNVPSLTNTTANFSTSLSNPGDYYQFTVDVVNEGSIDAMIDSVIKTPELTSSQAKYLNYIVEYENGESITTNQLVESGSFVRLKVRVEFRKDIISSDLPVQSETLNLTFTVNYIQSDETGTVISGNGRKIYADGNINDIGTIVTIGSEKFYTIGTEGDNIKMLSMYNLYVGFQYGDKLVPLENPTGKQSEHATGWHNDFSATSPIIGSTAFSNIESRYTGSIVEGYVNDYKTIIENDYGVDVVEARLITYSELTDKETFACGSVCSPLYPWIYLTSYWTGSSVGDSTSVYYVYSNGKFAHCYYDYVPFFGVRPVIVISKDYF